MLDLNFAIEGAQPLKLAASPHITFALLVSDEADRNIHTIMLQCQVQLAVASRQYSPQEQDRLADLFGEPSQWKHTLRSMLWTNTNIVIPSFTGSTVVSLQIPCTFDFNVAVTKYFEGINDGEIPVTFLFSGTVFLEAEGGLQVEPISWEKEATYRLPISVWREMMDAYYPNTAWLCLRRDAFDRLYAYKVRHGIATFEQALETAIP
jgi:hypothetical protein